MGRLKEESAKLRSTILISKFNRREDYSRESPKEWEKELLRDCLGIKKLSSDGVCRWPDGEDADLFKVKITGFLLFAAGASILQFDDCCVENVLFDERQARDWGCYWSREFSIA